MPSMPSAAAAIGEHAAARLDSPDELGEDAPSSSNTKRTAPPTLAPVVDHGLSRHDYLDAILADRTLAGEELRVLLALWKRTNASRGNLAVWPSNSTIAAAVGKGPQEDKAGDVRAVKRTLAGLRTKGYLEERAPGTWADMMPDAKGRDVTTLRVLALPTGHRAIIGTPKARGVVKTTTPGVVETTTEGVVKTTTQTHKGTPKRTLQKNPYTTTTSSRSSEEAVDNTDCTPWESTVKAALIQWAKAATDPRLEAEDVAETYEDLLELVARRNGPDVAEYLRDDRYTVPHRTAKGIADAPTLDDARYLAGEAYNKLLHRARTDDMHGVEVLNPPRSHAEEPLYSVTREEVGEEAIAAAGLVPAGRVLTVPESR